MAYKRLVDYLPQQQGASRLAELLRALAEQTGAAMPGAARSAPSPSVPGPQSGPTSPDMSMPEDPQQSLPEDPSLFGTMMDVTEAMPQFLSPHTAGPPKVPGPGGAAKRKGPRGKPMNTQGLSLGMPQLESKLLGPQSDPSGYDGNSLLRSYGVSRTPAGPVRGSRDANFSSQLEALRMMNGYGDGGSPQVPAPTDNFITADKRRQMQRAEQTDRAGMQSPFAGAYRR